MNKSKFLSLLLVLVLSLTLSIPTSVGVEEYRASETKTFTINDISSYYSFATANGGKSWISVSGHMSSTVSVPTDYLIFRTYIPLNRILPSGCTINSVTLNYRNGPGNFTTTSQYLWFGNLNGYTADSNEDSSSVSFSSFDNGKSTFTDISLDKTASWLFLQYHYVPRGTSSFFFCVDSISITYTYSGGSGDLVDTNEKLDIQLELTDNIWDNIKIIAQYIVELPTNIGKSLSSFFTNLGDKFGSFINNLGTRFETALNGLSSYFTNLGDRFGSFINGLGTRFENAISGLSVLFDALSDNIDVFLKELGSNITNGFSSAISGLGGVIGSAFSNAFQSLFPEHSGGGTSFHPDDIVFEVDKFFDNSAIFDFFREVLSNGVIQSVIRTSLTLGVISFVIFR